MTGDPTRTDVSDVETLTEQVTLLKENPANFEPDADWYVKMVGKIKTVSVSASEKLSQAVDSAAEAVNNPLN